MSQHPDNIPDNLRELFDAVGRGDVPEPPGVGDDVPAGIVEELGGEDLGSDIVQTNELLARIVDLLEQLPAAIWDEVEGR